MRLIVTITDESSLEFSDTYALLEHVADALNDGTCEVTEVAAEYGDRYRVPRDPHGPGQD